MRKETRILSALLLGATFFVGCDDSDPDTDEGSENEEEVITTVTLSFQPEGGGAAVTAAFDDPDGDGGGDPTIDTITLAADTTYTMTATFTNKLANPAEDITEEIEEEAEEHQIFIFGASVSGPATSVAAADALVTHAYADMESTYGENAEGADLPVGLENTITTSAAGTGALSFALRHLPPVGDTISKTDDLAAGVASGGLDSIAGDTDINVTFDLTVE